MSKKLLLAMLALTLVFAALSFGACTIDTGAVECTHEWKAVSVVAEATCTSAGSEKQKCARCGHTRVAEIPALGHDMQVVPEKNATCTETGYAAYEQCSRCDLNTKGTDIPLIDHSYGEAFAYDETEHYHECTVCHAKKDKTAHIDTNKDHACDDCGKVLSVCVDTDNDHKCDVCQEVLTQCADTNNDHKCDVCQEVLTQCADTNNDHKCDVCQEVLTQCADTNNDHKCDVCQEVLTQCADTNNDHKCDVCQEVLTQCADTNNDHKCDVCQKVLTQCADTNNDHKCDVCGKTVSEHTGGTATCNKKATCTVCGKEYGDLAEHNYGQLINETAATCKTEGEKEHYHCSVCGKNFDTDKNLLEDITIEKDSLNHEGQKEWTTKTATEHEETWTCCGAVATVKTAHTFENGTCTICGHVCEHVDGTATCKEKATCTVCGKEYGEVDASNHAYGDLVAEVPSTCTGEGKKAHYSCACGKYFDVNKEEVSESDLVIAKHHYENHFCKDCGVPEEGQYYYSLVQKKLDSVRYYAVAQYYDAKNLYLETFANVNSASVLTLTAVEGGYTMKLGDKYVEIGINSNQTAITLNDEVGKTVWVWNATYKLMTYVYGGTVYALGTHGTYSSISAYKESYFGKADRFFCEFTPVCTAEEHDFARYEITKAATCTEEGIKTYTCSVCGGERIDYTGLGDHDYEWVDEVYNCITGGVKGHYICKTQDCGKVFDEGKNAVAESDLVMVAVASHTDENGDKVCDVCGSDVDATLIEFAVTTLDFEDRSKNESCGDYGKTWNAYKGAKEWKISYFNNNNNAWDHIRAGKSGTEGLTALIGTAFAFTDYAITKVVVTHDAVKSLSKVELKVYSKYNEYNEYENLVNTYTPVETDYQSSTTMTFDIDTPERGYYYVVEYTFGEVGSSNGIVRVRSVDYYAMVDPSTLPAYTVTAQVENASVKFLDSITGEYTLTELKMFAGEFKFKVDNVVDGYKLESVKIGDTVLTADADGVYTAKVTDENVTVVVTAVPTYTVTVGSSSSKNATVKFYNETTEEYDLDSLTSAGSFKFKVTVAEGYQIDSVKVGNATLTGVNGLYDSKITDSNLTVVVETSEISSVGNEKVSVTIKDYATANGWVKDKRYDTININDIITVTAKKTAGSNNNTGKYYDTNYDWRIYQNEKPELSFTAIDGYKIVSITVTYNVKNNGVMTNGETQISSGTEVSVNANSIVFSVGNTGTATNGNIQITEIKVVYQKVS